MCINSNVNNKLINVISEFKFKYPSMRIKRYHDIDIIDLAESFIDESDSYISFCRCFPVKNGPYNNNGYTYNDGYCLFMNIDDKRYWKIIWFDVRSENIFVRTKYENKISSWKKISLLNF